MSVLVIAKAESSRNGPPVARDVKWTRDAGSRTKLFELQKCLLLGGKGEELVTFSDFIALRGC